MAQIVFCLNYKCLRNYLCFSCTIVLYKRLQYTEFESCNYFYSITIWPTTYRDLIEIQCPAMDYLSGLTSFLYFFQIIGLFPVLVEGPFQRVVNFLSVFNALAQFVLLAICYYYAEIMFTFNSALNLIVDVVQIVVPIVTHFVIIVESLYYRKALEYIWTEIGNIHKDPRSDLNTCLRRTFISFTVKFVVLQIGGTLIEIMILYPIAGKDWFRSRLTAEWSFIGCRSSYLLYILHVDIIRGILCAIGNDLKLACIASKSQLKSKRVEKKQQILFAKVDYNRKVFNKLYKINITLNRCFGYSLVLNLINDFMAIIIALYWNYFHAYKQDLTTGIIFSLLKLKLISLTKWCQNLQIPC